MDAQISRADLTEAVGSLRAAVGSLRALLAAIDAGELSCSAAYRNRLQGAVVALEALVEGDLVDVTGLALNGGIASPG